MEQELAIKLHKTTENRVRLATVPLIETRGLAQNSFSWREPSRKKVGGRSQIPRDARVLFVGGMGVWLAGCLLGLWLFRF